MRSSPACQDLLDRTCDLARSERLLDYQVRPSAKGVVAGRGLCREHDDRDVRERLVLPQIVEHLEPAPPGHHHVEYDDVGVNPPDDVEALDAVIGFREV